MQEQERKKVEGKIMVTTLINEVSRQLRLNQLIQVPTKQYMLVYNFSFDLKDDVIILKEIFQEWLQDYLKQQVIENLTQTKDFVSAFIYEVSLIKSLLRYFTLLFHKYERKMGESEIYIVELGLTIFDIMIMNHDVIKESYVQAYIKQINDIRLRNSNNQKQVLQSFLEILDLFNLAQNYRVEIIVENSEIIIRQKSKLAKPAMISPKSNQDMFLFPFVVDGTSKFYQELSISWIQKGTSQEYIKKAITQFNIEKELDENLYIIFSNPNDIYIAFKNEILEQRVEQIIGNPIDGLNQLFVQLRNSKDLSPITRMYDLYKASQNQLEYILNEFQTFVKTSIVAVFAEQRENKNIELHLSQIDNLQIFYEYCILLVQTCFENSYKFINEMELSFMEQLNLVERFIDKLAIYIHVSLKRKLTETNNDDDRQRFLKFNSSMQAFIRFLNSRSKLFSKITENLKDRIFRGEIKNPGFEEDFLKRLRREHQSIFHHIYKRYEEISSELTSKSILLGTNIQFTVFTPTNSLIEFNAVNRRDNVNIPEFLQWRNFTKRDCKRKIEFSYGIIILDNLSLIIGIVHLNLRFGPSPQQVGKLIVSNQQLFIMLSLKQSGKSKHDLFYQTGINYEEEINFQLEPLLNFNFVFLNADKYYLQTDQSKLKIRLIQNRALSLFPQKKVLNQVDVQILIKERDTQIQSKIVRLMKTNKEMIYPQLLQGVQNGLLGYYDFSVKDILTQIDELINRDYIKRDERINNKFIYIPQ